MARRRSFSQSLVAARSRISSTCSKLLRKMERPGSRASACSRAATRSPTPSIASSASTAPTEWQHDDDNNNNNNNNNTDNTTASNTNTTAIDNTTTAVGPGHAAAGPSGAGPDRAHQDGVSVQQSELSRTRTGTELQLVSGARSVTLPDLFSSIMSVECVINPHYVTVRQKSEARIVKAYKFSDKMAYMNHLVNFTYMAAAWAPLADQESLLTLSDWMHWTFYFDDQFDEGHLNDDPAKADVALKALLAVLDEDAPYVSVEEDCMRHMFQDTYRRFKLRSSKELQARYAKSIADYTIGVINQVKVHQAGTILEVDKYMEFRRATIGTYPSFALLEYCHNINLPQKVISHESIAICEQVATDITILHNDILSYKKDLGQNVEHNLVILLQRQGMDEQAAIDHVSELLQDCFRRWYKALMDLPAWGEHIDREVLRYLDVCRNVALGTLYWSFETGRYFGKDGLRVRETRVINLSQGTVVRARRH